MTSLRGVLKLGDVVVVENLVIAIKQVTSKAGLQRWHGSFTASLAKDFDVKGPYTLLLDDGRSGLIRVSHITHSSGQTLVEFQSTGQLG